MNARVGAGGAYGVDFRGPGVEVEVKFRQTGQGSVDIEAAGADQVLRGAPLKVDGVPIALDWKYGRMATAGSAHADVAAMPMEQAASICRLLLTTNMLLHPATGHAFMISPSGGRILLAAHFGIESTDAAGLEQLLVSMARTAQAMRKQCLQYLEGAGAASATGAGHH